MASSTAISTPELRLWHRVSWMIATLFWVGMIPHWAAKYSLGRKLGLRAGRGGGTMGSIVTTGFLCLLMSMDASIGAVVNFTMISFIIGLLSCIGGLVYHRICYPGTPNHLGVVEDADPNAICIDELVGTAVASLPAFYLVPQFGMSVGNEYVVLVIALLVFRYFDSAKPLGIKRVEAWTHGGPAGVMIDDIVAGLYAHIVVILAMLFQHSFVVVSRSH